MTTFRIGSAEAMERLGAAFSAVTPAGATIFLCGPLGAGKTTWVRGFLRQHGHRGAVKSPTYTLLEPYDFAGLTVNHFDFYRLRDASEFETAGLREQFDSTAVCLVEWPERVAPTLPAADLTLFLEVAGRRRLVRCETASRRGARILAEVEQTRSSA